MYFHSILTALAFICTFATIEFVFATIAWKGFGENIWRKLSKFLLENERHVDSERLVESERPVEEPSLQSDQKSEGTEEEQDQV